MTVTQPVVADELEPSGEATDRSAGQATLEPTARRSGHSTLSKAVLAAILLVETIRSGLLIGRNTAFLDEATYLSAGHQITYAALHGGPNLYYGTYFSGVPDLYPVLASLVDGVGGLEAARVLSLCMILGCIVLSYAVTTRIFSSGAGLLAAAVFSTVAGTQFLGAFATYDAMSLFVLCLATWITIVFATRPGPYPSPGVFLAIPVLVLANAVKYVTLEFDPIVLGLLFFLIAERHGYRLARRQVGIFAAGIVAMVSALLALGGNDLLSGVTSTTLLRHSSSGSRGAIFADTVEWVGIVVAISLIALVALVLRGIKVRWTSPAVGIGAVLVLGVLVAPVNQFRVDTATSLSKHVAFGAWFGSILCGIILAECLAKGRLRHLRGAAVGVLLVTMFAIGAYQANALFDEWPNATALTTTLRPLVARSGAPILADNAQVLQYYLGTPQDATRWDNMFFFSYRPPHGHVLTGAPAYRSAVASGYFGIIALDYAPAQAYVDGVVTRALTANPHYTYVGKVSTAYEYGTSTFVVWRHR